VAILHDFLVQESENDGSITYECGEFSVNRAFLIKKCSGETGVGKRLDDSYKLARFNDVEDIPVQVLEEKKMLVNLMETGWNPSTRRTRYSFNRAPFKNLRMALTKQPS
jgi:hypothetical protein